MSKNAVTILIVAVVVIVIVVVAYVLMKASQPAAAAATPANNNNIPGSPGYNPNLPQGWQVGNTVIGWLPTLSDTIQSWFPAYNSQGTQNPGTGSATGGTTGG